MQLIQNFPPLDALTQPLVPTEQAAHYLMRRPATLHAWSQAPAEDDVPVRPVRIRARLGWPVEQIRRAVAGVAA
jgi:hypothetical protein